MKKAFILYIFLIATTIFSQQNLKQKELLKRAEENQKLLYTKTEKVFTQSKKIIKEARKSNAELAELRAIITQCYYHIIKNDFKNLINTANLLYKRAGDYQNYNHQAIAKNFLFDAYLFNELHDQAYRELKQGLEIMDKKNSNDSLSLIIKSNLYVSFSNYYFLQKDYENKLKYLKLSHLEHQKFSNDDFKQKLNYVDYSNIAPVYILLKKIDSAKYYAELAISKGKNYDIKDCQFLNLVTLGQVASRQNNDEKALTYFKEAENLNGHLNHLNLKILYEELMEVYKNVNNNQESKLYKIKSDSLQLLISESKNQSLQDLLSRKETDNNNRYIYVLVASMLVILLLMYFVIRKNKILKKQEKISQQYLKEVSEASSQKDYSKLLEKLKTNDPSFINYFDDVFPDFSSKLIALYPKISTSEMEFCALLKMKIPTKEIAKYKFIEPQTVRNKKHLIRKKLDIPQEYDIYKWFDEF